MDHNIFTVEFAGKTLSVEINKTSCLSNGSCWIRYGDTVVMSHVTMSKTLKEDIDFFPLSVEYEEKLYADGRIPGSYLKREGKPSNYSILTSRCIDRFIRPFFPKDMRNDVLVSSTVLSLDKDYSPEVCAMFGVSVALSISDIPWHGPIVGIAIGLVDDKIIMNPNYKERLRSNLDLTLAASKNKIAMIEAGANEVKEDVMLKCINSAHEEIKKMIDFINEISKECGKPKLGYQKKQILEDIMSDIEIKYYDKMENSLNEKDKSKRENKVNIVSELIHSEYDSENFKNNDVEDYIFNLKKKIIRNLILKKGVRLDGRGLDDIRQLSCDIDLLPRVHGSAIFTRGCTQSMSIVTLGALSEKQRLDDLSDCISRRYIHHYNFPSYSVGETRPSRGPGRREIGHGALSERALTPVIPSKFDFPYTIRVVSEILSSNGSTSQASICSSCLALMAAGVPIKEPVAGISCGLITNNKTGDFVTLLDIQGMEDAFGEMDFKVAGTRNGITAIQVDIKNDGLPIEVVKQALYKTKDARVNILNNVMLPIISKPRSHVSKYAPKILTTSIPVEKIKDVIGLNGKVIQKLTSEFDVNIDIEEDGTIYILGINYSDCNDVLKMIQTISSDPEIGKTYNGKVTKITSFGAFVEIYPGKEGLIHISNINNTRINSVEDVLTVGDEVNVKLMNIDSQGRLNFSMKDAIQGSKVSDIYI